MTNIEAIAVLAKVKTLIGRNYKSAIRIAWETGDYRGQSLEQFAGELQRIRNGFGPTWLVNARPVITFATVRATFTQMGVA